MAIVLRPAGHQGPDTLGTERLCIVAQAGAHLTNARTSMPWVLSPEPCDARQTLLSSLGGKQHPLIVAAEIQDPTMQMEWVRRGHGLGLMPLRLATRGLPDGLALVDLEGVDLSLQVVALRSPHLNRLAKVVEAIAETVGKAIKIEA
ncbi:hypothetical protein FJ546_29100 [Mesorhizobium sp. B2-4-19]|nr:hypothetical protein FJ546_29100 [Mesorhizobium sp. B2-4-19]